MRMEMRWNSSNGWAPVGTPSVIGTGEAACVGDFSRCSSSDGGAGWGLPVKHRHHQGQCRPTRSRWRSFPTASTLAYPYLPFVIPFVLFAVSQLYTYIALTIAIPLLGLGYSINLLYLFFFFVCSAAIILQDLIHAFATRTYFIGSWTTDPSLCVVLMVRGVLRIFLIDFFDVTSHTASKYLEYLENVWKIFLGNIIRLTKYFETYFELRGYSTNQTSKNRFFLHFLLVYHVKNSILNFGNNRMNIFGVVR